MSDQVCEVIEEEIHTMAPAKRAKLMRLPTKDSIEKKKLQIEAYVYELATFHCTIEEIAKLCGISYDTVKRRYSELIAKGHQESKKQLRKAMIRAALNGNVAMQIWLSKNWLGFKDRQPDEAPTTLINIKLNEVP